MIEVQKICQKFHGSLILATNSTHLVYFTNVYICILFASSVYTLQTAICLVTVSLKFLILEKREGRGGGEGKEGKREEGKEEGKIRYGNKCLHEKNMEN